MKINDAKQQFNNDKRAVLGKLVAADLKYKVLEQKYIQLVETNKKMQANIDKEVEIAKRRHKEQQLKEEMEIQAIHEGLQQ